MQTSQCTSLSHQEYSCLIKWGVSSKKFKIDKWCHNCIDAYKDTHIVKKYLAANEREKESNKSKSLNKNKKVREGKKRV